MWVAAFVLLLVGLAVYGVRHMDDEQSNADLLAEAFDVVRSETLIHDALVIEMFAADLEAWDGGDVA